MEVVAILRILWDRRIAVGLGVVVAVAVGLLVGGHSRPAAQAGSLSTIRLVLDTANSQLVNAAPQGAATLPGRASLLADASASDAAAAATARAAGVPNDRLTVLGPSSHKIPPVDTPLVSQVYMLAATAATPYVVNIVADPTMPIIAIEAQAPDAAHASRLARAAAATVRSLLAADDGHRTHAFVLGTAAALQTKPVPQQSSHRRLLMLGGAIGIFSFWCVCVVLAAAALQRLRRREPTARAT